MRVLSVVLASLALSTSSFAQWHQMTGLTGGSIVTDVIEFNSDLYVATDKTGIFRLNEGSETWEKLNVPAQPNFPYLVVHNSELLAITHGKIFRTGDGTTWTEAAGPLAFINDVSSDGTLIVAATTSGIYLSSDAGVTWTLASDPQTQVTMIAAAVQGDVIWASAYSPAGTLFRSTDGGANWTKLTKGLNSISQIFMKGTDVFISEDMDGVYKSSDQGANWQLLKSVATSGNEFYASATNLYLLAGGQLSVSSNDGTTWTDKIDLFKGFNSQMLYGASTGIYLGTWGGGVYKTDVSSSVPWQSDNQGLTVQSINSLAFFNGQSIIAAGTYSFINIFDSPDQIDTYDKPWVQQIDGNGFKGATATAIGGGFLVGLNGGGVHRFEGIGAQWAVTNAGLGDKNVVDIERLNQDVFIATGDGVYKSINYGDTWTKKSVGNTLAPLVLHFNGKYLFAGTYDGLYRSKDVGETWNKIGANSLPDGAVGYLANVDSTLFAGTPVSGIYRSLDHGQSWTHLDNFAAQPVQCLSADVGVVFASTLDGQLYSSFDKGDNWQNVGGSISSGVVQAIAFDTNQKHFVAAGTNNSGVWLRPWDELIPPFFRFVASGPGESDSTFHYAMPIAVVSDQNLRKLDGTAMMNADLANYITVSTATGPVAFTATIRDNSYIDVLITNPVEGAGYTITVSPVKNTAGLASAEVSSRAFRLIARTSPGVYDIAVEGDQDQPIVFQRSEFAANFVDLEYDQLMNIIVRTLPEHGDLLILGVAPVHAGDVIAYPVISQMTYVPDAGYVGTDSWTWNGSESLEFTGNDAHVNITINMVVSVKDEESLISMYPVPVNDMLHIQHPSEANVAVTLHSATGARCLVATATNGNETTVDMSGLAAGLYVVRVESGGKIERTKIWKTK